MISVYKKLIVFSIAIFTYISSFAQFYYTGHDPANTKWNIIKSENYSLIYPREIDSLARQYLYLLESYRDNIMDPINIKPKRIPVVLHPYISQSNGVVSWAPKRMELFTTPPSHSTETQSWDKQLVIHESRHVGQISHFTQGIYRVLYYIIGEQATGIGLGLVPPKWTLEGDAVFAETMLSNSGRGRSADFFKYYRASFLEGDYRNLDKWLLGSYKHYTPSIYEFGFFQISSDHYFNPTHNRSKEIFSNYDKYWYSPNKMFEIKKYGYKNYSTFQKLWTNIWEEELSIKGETTKSNKLTTKKEKVYTEKTTPILNDSTLFFIKKGMYDETQLNYISKNNKEKKIRNFSYSYNKLIPSKNGIYWTEIVSDPRWGLRSYSSLFFYNYKNKKVKRLTSKTKYFNPALSSTEDTIAVAEYPTKGSSYLVLLEKTGKEISKTEAPYKGQIKESAFIGDDIYCSIITDKGLGIYKYSDKKWSEEIAPQHRTIERLRSTSDYIYFCSDLDGVLNIYSYTPSTKILWQLTNSKYGADYPFYDSKTESLIYSEYSNKGYNIVSSPKDSLFWEISSFNRPYKDKIVNFIASNIYPIEKTTQSDSLSYVEILDKEKYPSKKYNKLTHLFRIHSWAPFYYNIDKIRNISFDNYYEVVNLGATIYTQNSLGTATTMMGYSYHKGFHSGHFKFDYSGLYPVFELTCDVNEKHINNYKIVLEDDKLSLKITEINKPSVRASLNTYLPLRFNSRGWNRGLIPQLNFDISNDSYYSYSHKKDILSNRVALGLRYYQVYNTSASQIYPKWGFGISTMAATAIGSGELFGYLGYLYSYGYLPGFHKTNGIKLTASYQQQFNKGKIYNLGYYASAPRGYKEYRIGDKYFKVTADYALPVYLGDFDIFSVIYFKRMRLAPFIDYAMDTSQSKKNNLLSYGCEAIFDFSVLRYGLKLSAGLRYSHTGQQITNKTNIFDFIFNISL